MSFWVTGLHVIEFLSLTAFSHATWGQGNLYRDREPSNYFGYYEIFEDLGSSYFILSRCHIVDLKIIEKPWSAKPYKIFEVKKWNGPCNFCKEFILTKTTKSNEEN